MLLLKSWLGVGLSLNNWSIRGAEVGYVVCAKVVLYFGSGAARYPKDLSADSFQVMEAMI